MPSTREQLRQLVAERTAPPQGFDWDALMEALGQLEDAARGRTARKAAPLEAEDIDALVDLVDRRGRVPLRGSVPAPHCMPPEELLQYRALRILDAAGRVDCVRDSLEAVGSEAGSPALRELVRQLVAAPVKDPGRPA
ncbi:hypothetical protein [Pyxidicoccus trucidator]|uniref:hypothetical protein n=1 Tax=Pyxidicoccus trucidator TaxID=2709662 RepID=UPI0013DB3EC5|nr:hypothetical protein [Pyxidicoccus trucidator]